MSDNTGTPSAAAPQATESNGQESQEQVVGQEAAVAPPQPKKTKRLTYKADGAEYSDELPFEIDESDPKQVEFLKKHLSLSKAAQKRMSEAAQEKQKIQQFYKMLEENPKAVLSHPSLSAKMRQAAEEYLMEQIQSESESPEQKKLKQAEAILRREQEREQAEVQARQREQEERIEQHYAQQFQKTIIEALEVSKLPKTNKTVQIMAQLMSKNIKLGLGLDPKDLASMARDQYQSDLKEILGAYDEDGLLGALGDDFANKLRKADLKRLRNAQGQFQRAPQVEQSSSSSSEGEVRRPKTKEEIRAVLDKKFK